MQYTAEDIKQIEDFQKYARFLCEHFDISVELDSTQARTDGKVINLPNVVGLNEEELDMMYSILLHEVGHIKYSYFGPEYFTQLKTEYHAYLANAIEDARIENLLMKEFAGAKEMFTRLYTEHVLDKSKMKRLFKIEEKQSANLFSSMSIYIHNQLVHCDTAPLSAYATRTNAKKINEFIKNTDLNTLLSNAKLKNYKDVLKLTNTIYDLFVSFFRDTSKSLNFDKNIIAKKNVENSLKELNDKIIKQQKAAENIQDSLNNLRQKKIDWECDNAEKYNKLINEKNALTSLYKENKTLLSKLEKTMKLKKQIEGKAASFKKGVEKISSLSNAIQQNEELLKNKKSSVGKDLTQTQLTKLQEKILVQQKQLEAQKERIKLDEQKKIDLTQELDKAVKGLSAEEAGQSINDLNSELEKIEKKLEQNKKELSPLMSEYNEILKKLFSLEEQKNELISKAKEEVVKKLYELEAMGDNNGIPIVLLPDFIETPGWPESDKVQRELDQKISNERKEPVRNGVRIASMFGSNLRDISVYLDSKSQKVKDINLVDLFKEKTKFSLLPKLNERINITKYTTDKSVFSDWNTLEKHTVLTTQFDIIKQENFPKELGEFHSLLKENDAFINQLKAEFRNKFKFTKKPRYRGGKEDGDLDTRNLWKLATGYSEDYFEINNPKFINKITASILIDISGSQNKEESLYGKKIQILALALSEALKGIHVNHEILGYHAPINDTMRASQAAYTYNRRANSLETIVYKNFRQKSNAGISNIAIQPTDNSDGESIRIALNRLKREPAKSRVLFIITDGKPFLSDADINILDADLKAALREAVKNKVEVFALGFAPNGVDFYGDRYCYIKEWNDVIEFIKKLKF